MSLYDSRLDCYSVLNSLHLIWKRNNPEMWTTKRVLIGQTFVIGLIHFSVPKDQNLYTEKYILCNSHSRDRVFLDVMLANLVKKFSAFYGTESFSTVFTASRHSTLYWVRWFQSTPPYCTHLMYVLIFYYLYLGLPRSPFPSDFSIKLSHTFVIALLDVNAYQSRHTICLI